MGIFISFTPQYKNPQSALTLQKNLYCKSKKNLGIIGALNLLEMIIET